MLPKRKKCAGMYLEASRVSANLQKSGACEDQMGLGLAHRGGRRYPTDLRDENESKIVEAILCKLVLGE